MGSGVLCRPVRIFNCAWTEVCDCAQCGARGLHFFEKGTGSPLPSSARQLNAVHCEGTEQQDVMLPRLLLLWRSHRRGDLFEGPRINEIQRQDHLQELAAILPTSLDAINFLADSMLGMLVVFLRSARCSKFYIHHEMAYRTPVFREFWRSQASVHSASNVCTQEPETVMKL